MNRYLARVIGDIESRKHLMDKFKYLTEAPTKKRAEVTLILVLLIADATSDFLYQAIQFYQRINQWSADNQASSMIIEPVILESPKQIIPIAEVASLNIFGEYKPEPEEVAAPVLENLPETTLQLTLQGAFTHSERTKSSAIITSMESHSNNQDSSGEHYYFVNDVLPGNALLYAVNKDSVVLKRGDIYETLHFPGYATPIIDPTPRPQNNMISRVQESLQPSSAPRESIPNQILAATSLPEIANAEVRHSIQDRLARLRAQ